MCVPNGDFKRDEEGSYTFICHGKAVIHYVIVKGKVSHEIEKFTIKEVIKSDHLPIEI